MEHLTWEYNLIAYRPGHLLSGGLSHPLTPASLGTVDHLNQLNSN